MEYCFGNSNIFRRKNLMVKAGDKINGHKHNFDHVSEVKRGAVHLKATLPDGRIVEADCYAPTEPEYNGDNDYVLIRAGVEHEITALKDDTIFDCLYAHRTPQGDVIQTPYTGFREAYE